MSDLERGQMRFFDAARPPLTPGTWKLFTEQVLEGHTVSDGSAASPAKLLSVPGPSDSGLELRISGPRYALDPTEVLGCYPGPGPYADTDRLVHVVLGRRTLPWERRILGSSGMHAQYFAQGMAPWMALLVLRPDEIVGGAVQTNQAIPAAYWPPADGVQAARVNTLTLTWGVLKKNLPRAAELGLCAHVREMCRLDRELRGDDDGFAAIVMSNRVPRPVNGKPTRYVAALVSLEPWGDFWSDATVGDPMADGRADATSYTLVALTHWSFETGDGATFADLAKGLGAQGIERLGERDADPSLPAGALILEEEGEAGTTGSVVYRPPLLPVPVARSPQPPATRASEAIEVDQAGRPHVGEASAFELGRLMALSSPAILDALLAFREQQYNAIIRLPPTKVPLNPLKGLLDRIGKGGIITGGGPSIFDPTIWGGGPGDDPWSPGGGTPGPDDGPGGGWLGTLGTRGGGITDLFNLPTITGGPSLPGVPGTPGGLPGAETTVFDAATLDLNFGALMVDVRANSLTAKR